VRAAVDQLADLGAEVQEVSLPHTDYALPVYYLKAQKVRTLIKADFDAAFEQVDAIVAPTSPTTAFRIGEKVDDPLQMYLSDVFTLSVNLAGICGISVPCGFDGQGLPIGMQIMGPAFGEGRVLRVAHAYEQATGWHERRAKL